MLEIVHLQTGYGAKQVIYDLSVNVPAGKITALIGPNGAGKSTLLKAVFGLIPAWKGHILFNGTPVLGCSPATLITRGLVLALQGNRVFDELTVMENLEIGGWQVPAAKLKSRIADVLGIFPVVGERLSEEAGRLSGGERQMLALARALIPEPRLLMLDEPSLGLSPKLVERVLDKIAQINHELGTSVLIVEQKVRNVLEICHEVHSLKLGKLGFSGSPSDLLEDKDRLRSQFV